MTGVGAYYYIVWAVWLRHCLNERQDEFVLNWPTVFALPEVISSEDYEKKTGQNWTKDYSNGHIQANGNGNGYGHGTREDRKSV